MLTPFEVKAALDGGVLLYDTREQDTPALRARLRKTGMKVERKKLDFGDYSAKYPINGGKWLDLSQTVAVERKMNFTELAACYCNGRRRFRAEFERAREKGAKLYLLVEGETWERAYAGKYRSKMQPQALIASMLAWLTRYNCQILFCQPETSGKLIRDILYREAKERLERMP